MQLSWLPSCMLRARKLYGSKTHQLPYLSLLINFDWTPPLLPEKTITKEVSGIEQIRQLVPHDIRRCNHKVRYKFEGSLREESRKRWMALC